MLKPLFLRDFSRPSIFVLDLNCYSTLVVASTTEPLFLTLLYRCRYVEEVGELESRCDDLATERNAMLVKLEGLKRRKQVEKEVRGRSHPTSGSCQSQRESLRRCNSHSGEIDRPKLATASFFWLICAHALAPRVV